MDLFLLIVTYTSIQTTGEFSLSFSLRFLKSYGWDKEEWDLGDSDMVDQDGANPDVVDRDRAAHRIVADHSVTGLF